MLKKVISGGQTGADEAGLYAAKQFGIPTGGWAPKGFITENGSNERLKTEYNLKETSSSKYPPRTYANASESDGTIRFAKNFYSAGEKCTLKAIEANNKPYIDVHIMNPPTHQTVADWINDNNIEILNVAGNRESTCNGLFEYTVNYLTEVFKLVNVE